MGSFPVNIRLRGVISDSGLRDALIEQFEEMLSVDSGTEHEIKVNNVDGNGRVRVDVSLGKAIMRHIRPLKDGIYMVFDNRGYTPVDKDGQRIEIEESREAITKYGGTIYFGKKIN